MVVVCVFTLEYIWLFLSTDTTLVPELNTTCSLTFRGQCIVIYSYNKSQQDALFLKFILIKNSTYFGQIYVNRQ